MLHVVRSFVVKPHRNVAWIDGSFFVLSPKVLEYLESNRTLREYHPIERLAAEGQLSALIHRASDL